MATAVSPAPLSTNYSGLYRKPSGRQLSRNPAVRPHLRRNSPLSASATTFNSKASAAANLSLTGDSSDDDVPAPIKFSAAVKALLGEDGSSIGTSPVREAEPKPDVEHNGRSFRNSASYLASRSRPESPSRSANGSPVPRVVRLGTTTRPNSRTLERDGSFQYQNLGRTSEMKDGGLDMITPAARPRSVRLNGYRLQSRSPEALGEYGSNGSSGRTLRTAVENLETEERPEHLGTVTRTRNAEDAGAQSTMRIKRVGKVTGSFLNGPVRRGMIRRQSEDDEAPREQSRRSPEPEDGSPRAPGSDRSRGRRSPSIPSPEVKRSFEGRRLSEDGQSPDLSSQHVAFASTATVVPANGDPVEYRPAVSPKPSTTRFRSTPASDSSRSSSKTSSTNRPVFKVPSLPPTMAVHDQENEPPPTFKRTKQSSGMLDKVNKISVLNDQNNAHATPATASPARKPLAVRSQNTPHRPPPPPPKMSVLETATATAGAAASAQSRKKRNHISINGKTFTRLDCVGRGGSSRVYRVMAENYKIFALKRVNLEDADPASIAGYKGEIDLLRKLEKNDRVVSLYDYEVNDEKKTLSVLMEYGELDLEHILNQKIKTEDAKADFSFTRFYWKEMLECVKAAHEYDIVHSDLKPANFLLVKGRLKLIDFGIANTIADDTVNVHREQQVGTPNYMAPEALVDCNAARGLPSTAGRLLKLGKPSDIWSLGCILYRMVYGQPPFAHLPTYERIMSIPNPKVLIEYPSTGIGGVPVPASVIRLLRRCLQRDQTLRPTMDELLSESNEFLNPDKRREDTVPMSQEMLGRILHNVVNHCRQRGAPEDSELSKWPEGFFAKIRQALEEEDMKP